MRLIESPKTVEENCPLVPRKIEFAAIRINPCCGCLDETNFQRLGNTDLSTASARFLHFYYFGKAPVVTHLYHSWAIHDAGNAEFISSLTSDSGIKVTNH